MKWLENSSDEEFAMELADWIDIPTFAQYVATHKILGNFDDMAGPGRNFLLWYGLEEEKFTVISWDMNLALVGNLYAKMIGGMMPSGGMSAPPDQMPAGPPGLDMGIVMELMSIEGMPDMSLMAAFTDSIGMDLVFGNILKDRFVANEAFADVIANTEAEITTLWSQEYALQVIDQLSPLIPASDTLSEEQITLDIERLKNIVNIML